MNNTIKARDIQLNEFIIKESDYIKTIDSLSRKVESTIREKDDTTIENNHLQSKLKELIIIKTDLELTKTEKEKIISALEDEKRNLLIDLKDMTSRADELQKKLERVFFIKLDFIGI
jgi:hypothetical protein